MTPSQRSVRLDWTIPDPKHMPPDEFRRIRDLIREKVRAALMDLGVAVPLTG